MGDLWIDMYKSVNIPYRGEMTIAYTKIHSLIPWLRLKIAFFSIKVSLRSHQKYFSGRWKNPSFIQIKG